MTTPNIIKVTLSIDGHTVSSISRLNDEIIAASRGPMSLEAACMSLVREICQSLHARVKAKAWNGIKDEDAEDEQ